MNIQQTDGVNFGATLQIQVAKQGKNFSKTRLANLAKTFEERTAKKYPEDKFVLSVTKEGADLYGESKNFYLDGNLGKFDKDGVNKLFNLTDIQFTDKFKRLFGILCGKNEERTTYSKLCTQLERKGADTSDLDDAFFEATKEATQESLYKDSVLKTFVTER